MVQWVLIVGFNTLLLRAPILLKMVRSYHQPTSKSSRKIGKAPMGFDCVVALAVQICSLDLEFASKITIHQEKLEGNLKTKYFCSYTLE